MPDSRVQRLLRLLDQQADELLRLEHQAASNASGELRARLNQVRVEVTRQWILVVGSDLRTEPTPAQVAIVVPRLRAILGSLRGDPWRNLIASASQALTVGGQHAAAQADRPVDTARLHIPADVSRAVTRTAERISRQVDEAVARLPLSQSYLDVQGAVKHAAVVVPIAESNARWIVNRAVAAGTAQAADRMGLQKVWRAERSACLHCLAYSGHIDSGSGFPPGLTYADRPLNSGPLPTPPLHPNCRCQLAVWNTAWETEGQPTLADDLIREADRSVLKGWPSGASNAAALRAVERALNAGAADRLPKTVVAEAEAALRRGRFRNRDAP